MPYYIGAYATMPKPTLAGGYEPDTERRFFEALSKLPGVKGLELPFYGSLHPHNVDAYLSLLNPSWSFVITGLPGTMNAIAQDPFFGLASHATSGRTAALECCRRMRDSVATVNAKFGRQAVTYVELHTAPKQGTPGVASSAEALTDSLREICGWDWHGAKLVIEHCDAFVASQPPQKGFLRIEQELEVLESVQALRSPVRMILNWGRSAIEGHSADTALAHAKVVHAKGLLAGLMFSGACAKDEIYGDWQDTHAPFAPAFGLWHGAPRSELTAERGKAWFNAAGGKLDILGIKIQPLPNSVPLDARIEYLRDAIHWLGEISR